MAGCMLFVFGALGEFVVVKVLDVQYQLCLNRVPKGLPMVSRTLRTQEMPLASGGQLTFTSKSIGR